MIDLTKRDPGAASAPTESAVTPAPRLRLFLGDWRGLVLAALGALTVGVAVLSVVVNYRILEPRWGSWAYAIVGALDVLWVVLQSAEILAANNRRRAWLARGAGLVLTVGLTAIPTVDLIMTTKAGQPFQLAVVLTPAAIGCTKIAWLIVLPALGRRVSEATRSDLADQAQAVADQLERMEAETAHRVELLTVAARLETTVAKAETAYRLSVLRTQQKTAVALREQAAETQQAIVEPLPESVAAIRLPELGSWSPLEIGGTAPARAVTQVSAPALPAGTGGGTGVPPEPEAAGTAVPAAELADLAAVAGVAVPVPNSPLSDAQMAVVLRALRHHDDPPASYRQAREAYRAGGYVGSEERVRRIWGDVLAGEQPDVVSEGAPVAADEDAADDDEESAAPRPESA